MTKERTVASLKFSPVSIGGNVFGWTLDERKSFEILDAFADAGFTTIDTADIYSAWIPGNKGGESETIIGKWLKKKGNRNKLTIATKVGVVALDGKTRLSANYIKDCIDASLRRLQTDYVDLYISHADDPETPVAETISAFNELIKEGKVREIGASNLSAERISGSIQFSKDNNLKSYISIQPLYNLYDRQLFETQYLPLAEKEKLAVTPYYALASGFLSGKYRTEEDLNKSPRGGGIKDKYLNERGYKILEALDEVAVQTHAALPEIAIAWQLHKPYITSPIASATTIEQVKSLANAVSLQLTSEQIALLDQASAFDFIAE